ncbi:MAG: acetylornithine/N-succinyldiaminopimelate aminotransferase [Rickettsiales bacterium]|jgi:acetylornithine/N-succinyldiaminopimelate aminotransferase
MTNKSLLPIHSRMNVKFSSGEGVYLFDDEGKKYLDFGAGIAVNSLGHCHPILVEALTTQAKKLWHVSNIYQGKELENLADKLVANTFADHVFFCNSGAESVECGIKMMRRYFYTKNKPEKYRIITFKGAFHGRTMATISAAGKEKYLEGFKPALEGFDNVEFGNIEAVKNAITDQTAGILIEPIQGEEGIRVSTKQYMLDLRKLADENDLLLMFDEVQCGFGRLGYLYGYEYFGVTPDIISSAKGIGGGFPLGACLATKEAASGMVVGTHGTTFGGNPLAMAVGDAVLKTILSDGFLQEVKNNGDLLKSSLEKLQEKFPEIIVQVRGVGLMLGIKLHEKFVAVKMVSILKENGLLVVGAGENVVRILPPLIITKENIFEAIEILTKTFQELSN